MDEPGQEQSHADFTQKAIRYHLAEALRLIDEREPNSVAGARLQQVIDEFEGGHDLRH